MGILSDITDVVGTGLDIFDFFDNRGDVKDKQKLNAQLTEQQLEIQKRMLDAVFAGSEDASGNRIVYDKATNTFKVIPTAATSELLRAGDAENLARLTTDSGIRREGLVENARVRGNERQAADTFLRELMAPSPYNAEAMTGLITEQGMRGLNEGFDDATEALSTTALRTDSGANNAFANLAERRGESAADIMIRAALEGPQQAETLTGARNERLRGNYNLLASRGANYADVPFQPTSAGDGLASALASRQNTAPQGLGVAAGAGVNAANISNTRPQTPGLANLDLPGLSIGLEQLFNRFGNRQLSNTTSGNKTGPLTTKQTGF